MKAISELELHHLALEQASFAANPYPHFTDARARHPWLAESGMGYVVTNYRAVRDLMAMDGKLHTAFAEMVDFMGARGTPWGRFQLSHILTASGAEHKRLREILAPVFTPRQANQWRPVMREVISKLLEEWAPKGAFDFEEFASYFPITVQCRMIGASPEEIPRLRSSLEAFGLSVSMDRQFLPALQNAMAVLDAFVGDLCAEREAVRKPGDANDMLDILLEAKSQGRMTQREIDDMLIFLFVAGYDTSKNILTLTMYEMVSHPEDYERCATDLAYCVKVIDETMRIHGSVSSARTATQDIEYRDVRIPAGTVLVFPWSVVGQDPESAEEADQFRPDRVLKTPHVGFALGPHMCLGQYIARAQLAEGLHVIAQRIKHPKSPGPNGWRPFPGVWGIHGLPITFEPA